jgi:AraC family chemosensory pili system transcriptional regulator ChpD
MTAAAAFAVSLLRRPGFEVAWFRGDAGAAGFPRHTHDDLVISANLAGAERIWLDGRDHEAGPGEVTAYNPGALQASRGLGPAGSAWSFVSLYVEPAFAAEALGLPAPPTLERPVIADPAVAAPLLALGALCGPAARGAPALLEEAALAALSAVARGGLAPAHRAAFDPARRAARDPAMDRVAALLMDRLADPPDLAALAREAGISREHLVRRFSASRGLPPMAWAMQRRLARARTLLRRGQPPAEVAAALGFADQAHLTRAFRDAAGITPGRYRRGG